MHVDEPLHFYFLIHIQAGLQDTGSKYQSSLRTLELVELGNARFSRDPSDSSC